MIGLNYEDTYRASATGLGGSLGVGRRLVRLDLARVGRCSCCPESEGGPETDSGVASADFLLVSGYG